MRAILSDGSFGAKEGPYKVKRFESKALTKKTKTNFQQAYPNAQPYLIKVVCKGKQKFYVQPQNLRDASNCAAWLTALWKKKEGAIITNSQKLSKSFSVCFRYFFSFHRSLKPPHSSLSMYRCTCQVLDDH